ncbi:hypothetical protein [Nocardioides furvisabuli]|uniref:hypothetical protein n=1 Tax=Nocardioides furvisabuli TaxID=375542 RepID=UPI001E5C03B1|nr:hypothetical protein [Nocardioides furvisabuli]
MDHAKHWRRLVRDLDRWSSASAVAPDRIRVLVTKEGGGQRPVVIVMTPEHWGDMIGVAHGSFESALDRVKQTLLALRPHEGFAVYTDYCLDPSTTDSLPDNLDLPEPGSGVWVPVHRQDGHRT